MNLFLYIQELNDCMKGCVVEKFLKCPKCLKNSVTKKLVTHIGFLILGLVFLLSGLWCIGVAISFWDPKSGSYFLLGWGGFFTLTSLLSLSKFITNQKNKVKQVLKDLKVKRVLNG